MDNSEKTRGPSPENGGASMTSEEQRRKAKFEVYGEEMIEKEVKQSGNSGRVYLPPEWVGKNVKIIRID
jgi:putative transposon-encoded protein